MRSRIRAAFGLLELFLLFVTPLAFYRDFSDQFITTKSILTKALVLVGALGFMLRFNWSEKGSSVKVRNLLPAFLLVVAALVSCISGTSRGLSLSEVGLFLCGPVWFALLVGSESGESRTQPLAVMIAAASAVIATIGVIQWAGYDPMTIGGYAIRWGTMVPSMRLYSTFGNPNLAAGYIGGAVFLSAALAVSATTRILKILGALSIAVTLVAMVGMKSQGAWLGLALGVVVAACIVIRARLSVIAILALILLPIGLFGAMHSVSLQGRIFMWRASWPMFFEHPVLGSGWGSFQLKYPELQAQFLTAHPYYGQFWTYTDQLHNDPLQILLEGGLLSLAAFVCVLWSFGNELRNNFEQSSREEQIWLAATAGGVTSLIANACFNFQLAVPPTLILLFTFLAVPYILRAKSGAVHVERRMPRLLFQSAATAAVAGVIIWLGLGVWHQAQASHFEALGSEMEGRGILTKAEELFRRGLEAEPESGSLQYALSRTLYLEGKYDEALNHASLAERTLADPHLVVLKARIQDGIGLRSNALASFQRALWLDPSLDSVKPDIERLSNNR